ncbi:MAG TPA: glucuronate isomerase, partial [Phycisphaerae bacterium]|nr:glucuronate isomerase [Phycisphaerae bacterium]
RKHPNLMIFGCWWFINNPLLIEEVTRMRLEMLGLSFIPQHSDARVLEQVIYKWSHSREIVADVLADKYADLARTGWTVTEADIRRDVALLLGGNFERFCENARRT